jgi:hypothetical protein
MEFLLFKDKGDSVAKAVHAFTTDYQGIKYENYSLIRGI